MNKTGRPAAIAVRTEGAKMRKQRAKTEQTTRTESEWNAPEYTETRWSAIEEERWGLTQQARADESRANKQAQAKQ